MKRIAAFALVSMLMFWPSLAVAAQTITMMVSPGESLIQICQTYLEDPAKWPEVARFNRLEDPHHLRPYTEIRIPVRLLKGLPLMATVSLVHGRVEFQLKGRQQWQPAKVGQPIPPGARIRTRQKAGAELRYSDGATVLLRANTELTLTRSQQKGGGFFSRAFFLKFGRSITRIKEKITGKPRFKVRTRTSVVGVRGTAFRTAVDEKQTARFEVLEGTVGVAGQNKGVEISAGQGTLVEKGRPPKPPRQLLPPPELAAPRPIYKQMPLKLDFKPVKGAAAYRVLVGTQPDLKELIQDAQIPPSGHVRLSDLADGTYYLQSMSIDGWGLNGLSSDPYRLSIRVHPLPPFVNTPEDGAEYHGRTIDFQWLQVADAVRYHLQIAADPKFQTALRTDESVTSATYTSKPLEFGDYYFRIASLASDGYQGAWSDVLNFTLIPPPPVPPLQAPQLDDKRLTIRWQDMGEGLSYHFQMARDEKFSDLLKDEVLDQPSITLDRPKAAGSYFIRTSSIDAKGTEGAFSPAQRFEIEKPFPYHILGIIMSGLLALIAL